ncbi:AAA ATPase midasin [Blastocladiella emersonii ATCC 22665]|nr:AAA ATPase midasin [Blastocladiella emersonii ATCC 22665]
MAIRAAIHFSESSIEGKTDHTLIDKIIKLFPEVLGPKWKKRDRQNVPEALRLFSMECIDKVREHLLRDVPATPHAEARISSATKILGLAWIHLGLAFMKLAVPTSPLDPATRFSLVHQYTRQLQGNLELELQVHLALQIRDKGMATNPTIEWLRARLAAVRRGVEDLAYQLYLRPPNAADLIKQLHGEFQLILVLASNPETFLAQLLDTHGHNATIHQRTAAMDMVNSSPTMFVARTTKKFPPFMDVLEPVYSGSYDVLYELSLIAMSQAEVAHEQPNSTSTQLNLNSTSTQPQLNLNSTLT